MKAVNKTPAVPSVTYDFFLIISYFLWHNIYKMSQHLQKVTTFTRGRNISRPGMFSTLKSRRKSQHLQAGATFTKSHNIYTRAQHLPNVVLLVYKNKIITQYFSSEKYPIGSLSNKK